MNLTLHLTEGCNMACSYCTRTKTPARMSEAVLDAACDLAFSQGSRAGLCFFGGEPMLEQPLIARALDRCAARAAETGMPFQCKMTTNGTLLSHAFLERASAVHMGIGLSFDGTAQDICRRFADGRGSFDLLEEKVRLLLRYLPDSYAMMTIAPQAVPEYAAAVRYLHALGFRRITATIAYGRNVRWEERHIAQLTAQLSEIAEYYIAQHRQGTPFYFSPLDGKIRDALRGCPTAERCHLGFRQMPVAPDGRLYACTQFIGDAAYCLGDVFSGIDREKQRVLAQREATPDICRACALRARCTNACGCLNRLETGDERKVSPLQCTYERLLIQIADETAEQLYQADPDAFRRHYMVLPTDL